MIVVPTANYLTSRDYCQLWELAHNAAVVCVVDTGYGKHYACRDIAITTHLPEWHLKFVQVGSRGVVHVWAESLEEFIAGCEQCNLEWLVPPAPAVAELSPGGAEAQNADHVAQLAAIIRRVDGNNSMGAAELAEAILERYPCAFLADPPAALAQQVPTMEANFRAAMNKPLSPAAQAVMYAYLACGSNELSVAAVLRAAVAHAVPAPPESSKSASDWVRGMEDRQRIVRFRLLSIADELDPPDA